MTVDQVRFVDDSRSLWPYLDNGSSHLEWSAHDNTAVMRWSLLHQCVVLAGTRPQLLVEPVSARALRAETQANLAGFVSEILSWPGLDDAWAQPHTVITLCRKLATLAHGRVFGKAEALDWAIDALDPQWHELLVLARADRPDPWLRVGRPARAGTVEATRRFATACLDLAESKKT